MIQLMRSVLFVIQMYLVMAIMALVLLPYSALSRQAAAKCIRAYCLWVRWSAGWIVGLSSQIRGCVPDGGVLICSKHQSFFDILILCSVLPEPRFIMKQEIRLLPIVGHFARRIGCIAIDRGKGSEAVGALREAAKCDEVLAGQLVIFPQGTRVEPGKNRPYKIGAAILYEGMGVPCVPVATNVGMFWPRRSLIRRTGNAVVEFLPEIKPGLSLEDFRTVLSHTVETASDQLIEEAGGLRKTGPSLPS